MTNPSFCAECARRGPTCCATRRIVLTPGDVTRIERWCAQCCSAQWSQTPWVQTVESAVFEPAETDPLWDAWLRRGLVDVLRQGPQGCVFLGADGCVLPLDVRPLICRLYPFEYTESAIKGVWPHLCPRPEADNTALLLALLGMSAAVADSWRQQLYAEISQ